MSDARLQQQHAGPESPARLAPTANVKVKPSLPDYPRSCAANYVRPAAVTSEEDVLRNLKQEWRRRQNSESASHASRGQKEIIIADLHDFEVYRCPKTDARRPSELASLHLFDVKAKNLCFDGYVRMGHVRYYVERVHIDDLSIEGYGSHTDPGVITYVQTRLASKDATSDIWLRLQRPSPRYERFHSPFAWVAVLGKHALDYMDEQPRNTVSLESFEGNFHRWLVRRFGSNTAFEEWFTLIGNVADFRVALHAYAEFFYIQACNLSTAKQLTSHPVWAHCKIDRKTAVVRQPNRIEVTLTTTHVFESFQHMYFARKLRRRTPATSVLKMQRKRKTKLGFADDTTVSSQFRRKEKDARGKYDVRVGDVVSILPNESDKTKWRESGDEWLAYVQNVEPAKNGGQRLMVLWLYRPADTNMCLANYMYPNELFLSDNCNCGEQEILSTDVKRRYSVEWSPESLNPAGNYFVRQTYITQDSAFVTVKDDHKICSCRKPKPSTMHWCAGDAVYVTKKVDGQKILEPVVIHKIDFGTQEAQFRTLLRLGRDCSDLALQAGRANIAPNELVLTGKLQTLPISRIQRACHVTFVEKSTILEEKIPFPYNRRGAGDYWYISMGLHSTDGIQRLVYLQHLPKGFHEAQETPLPYKKLRGLSLFSGGGGLDRGLEEGGAVEFQTSVDYDSAAIHTQRANCRDPQNMRLFCGSVDDYLQALLSGDKNYYVARVGEVDVIAAGSPCPGFSALQQNMLSEQSLTYASHVTTFCTAVDLYRPLYGILENVVNMASTRTGFEEQNVLSQLVACLVSMGYQVNQYIMDSWTYGSCQRRSRIILTIAAPGLEPILQRPHTHSRSYEDTQARSLGKLPNGERFGDREHYATPFPHVTAEEATRDLPDIGNGNVQACIRFPDHRLSRPTNSKARALVECIPRYPPGQNYAKALKLDLVPSSLRLAKKETGKAYQRIKANELIPTITTDVSMQDARNGASVHWSQHRPLSIQEAKRTQGYEDHEPVIGTLSEQWRILGNGVDRRVSFAVGLALRDAFTKSRRPGRFDESLEDEAEVLEDVEDVEEEFGHLSEAEEHLRSDFDRKMSSSSSGSSSTNPPSSTRDTRQQFDMALSLDGAFDVDPPPERPEPTSPRDSLKTEVQPVPTESILSRLSRTFSTNLRRLSLPSLPSLPKRQREVVEGGVEDASTAGESSAGPLKRMKTAEVRRTTSPAPIEPEVVSKREERRASMPPHLGATHTRRPSPAEFAPRAWHKKIGAPGILVDLT